MNIFRIGVIGAIVVLLITGLMTLGSMWENNGANEILVIQAPYSGKLTVHNTAGMKWQGWGKATHYHKSNEFAFDKGSAIKIRFNDGGHADIFGSARFDLPQDEKSIVDIHQTFGNQEAVLKELVRRNVVKAVYMTGPLMSSKESYAERRTDLINLIEDQASKGVFQTIQKSKEVDDLITGAKKWVTVADLKHDSKTGEVLRQELSPFIRFHIALYNITIQDIDYEEVVDNQIKTQQQATMDVQIAKTNSIKAEQDVLTAEKQGQAAATKAKWEQEVLKATAVTKAEQEKDVATTQASQRLQVANLDRQAAEQTKQQQILLGEGESTRAKLVMQANGALEQKLATYFKVAEVNAQAIGSYRGALVPSVMMGASGNAGGGNSSVVDLISMLNAKAAKDLSLDLGVTTNVVPETNKR